MISIDFAKAQNITKERLRQERQPLLNSLDIEVIKNISNPIIIQELETKKQLLRDITIVVDSLTTIEELKQISTN